MASPPSKTGSNPLPPASPQPPGAGLGGPSRLFQQPRSFGGHQRFAKVIHLDDPSYSPDFTMGTINVRHVDGDTFVDLNVSDGATNGRDYAEYTIRLDGIHDLTLSDFVV